jgi:hypothetical protein
VAPLAIWSQKLDQLIPIDSGLRNWGRDPKWPQLDPLKSTLSFILSGELWMYRILIARLRSPGILNPKRSINGLRRQMCSGIDQLRPLTCLLYHGTVRRRDIKRWKSLHSSRLRRSKQNSSVELGFTHPKYLLGGKKSSPPFRITNNFNLNSDISNSQWNHSQQNCNFLRRFPSLPPSSPIICRCPNLPSPATNPPSPSHCRPGKM